MEKAVILIHFKEGDVRRLCNQIEFKGGKVGMIYHGWDALAQYITDPITNKLSSIPFSMPNIFSLICREI